MFGSIEGDAKTRRLKEWWAGPGRERWATSNHPWTALNKQLRAHGVPAHMANGLTTNIFKLARQPMPNSRASRLAALKPEHKAALRRAFKGE